MRTDGTRALTGAWNAGSFAITALSFTATDQIFIQSSAAKLFIENTDTTDVDGGRAALVTFSGFAGDATPLTQAQIVAQHDGSGADDKSRLVFQVNEGAGIVEAMRISSAGDVVASNGVQIGNTTTATAGMVRWTGTHLEVHDGTGWSTLAGTNNMVVREVPSGAINGSNVTFTLANTPLSGTLQLFLNGLLLDEGASNDYTLSGNTITMNYAPEASPGSADKLLATYLY